MRLPSGKTVNSFTPIYSDSNFTWGEATKNCTRPIQDLIINKRLISDAVAIENRIIATAKSLDNIRSQLDNRPIYVNSWYRPSHINARVGGALWSRHQFGDAVDIVSHYFTARDIYNYFNHQHTGGLGAYPSFIHLDWRGHKARW